MASGGWGFDTQNQFVKGWVDWWSTSNGSAANSSQLEVVVYLQRTNHGFTTQGNPIITVWFDNDAMSTSGCWTTITSPTWVVVHHMVRTVNHNNDGSRSLRLWVSGHNDAVSGFRWDTSQHINLVSIPRHASINSWSNTSRTHNSATFSWSANSNISRVVCTFNGTERFNSGVIDATSGNFTVSGLTENTTYNNVRITVTRRDSSLTTNSGNISFTTPFTAPTSNLSIGTPTINSIPISWSSNFACDEVRVFRGGTECFVATGLNVSSGNITLLPTHGISHGTSYSLTVRVRRRASQATATSVARTATTLRVPTIATTSPSAFDIGNSLSMTMENINNDYTLRFQYRNISNTWVTLLTTTSSRNATNTFTPNADSLFERTVSSRTLQCRVVVSTTLNNTTYTEYSNGIRNITADVVNSNPTFTDFTLVSNRTNTMINELIGGTRNMISGEGDMQLDFPENSASSINHATILRLVYRVEHNDNNVASGNITYNRDDFTFIIPNASSLFRTPGHYTVFVRTVDSRQNLSAEVPKTFTVFPYHRPVISATLTRFNDFERWVQLNLNATISRLTVSSVSQNKIQSIQFRHAEVGEDFPDFEDITGFTTTNGTNDDQRATRNIEASATSGFVNLDSALSYNFQFRIRDNLHTSTIFSANVSQGIPLFSVFENGKTAVNTVPDLCDDAPTLQVGGDTNLEGYLNVEGRVDVGDGLNVEGQTHARGNFSGSWVRAIRNAAIKVTSKNMVATGSNGTGVLATQSATGWFAIGQHNDSTSDSTEHLSFGFITNEDYHNDNNMFTVAFTILRNGAMTFSIRARNALFLLMHPPGTIYFTTSNTNPGTIYGGTWEAWGAGRVVRGVGNNGTTNYTASGTAGGTERHTLTAAESGIREHNHNFTGTAMGNHNHFTTLSGDARAINNSVPQNPGWVWGNGWQSMQLAALVTSSNSAGTPTGTIANRANANATNSHENRSPFITAYMWRRTA